ncbi:MAG: glycosyl hydrolase [Trueperaceae bacterium]|nr:glycosyl hydrolase [Trueperaceae bacterium]
MSERAHAEPRRTADRRPRRSAWADRAARALLLASVLVATTGCGAQEAPDVFAAVRSTEPLASYVHFGAFTYGGVWGGMEPVVQLETALGERLAVVHWFMSFDHAYDPALVAAASTGGRVPLISWQPMNHDLHDIAAGRYDDYLRTWAHGIRDAHSPVYLRPFPEMNGDWVPWNGDPQALRDAWTHLTTLFDHEGATNVRWVWSPNVTDEPRTDDNRMEHYYPGTDHVDVLALSGYNWGDTRSNIGWRSFEDVFAGGYARLEALGPQPIWIAETASTDVGGDKAAWIRDMFATTAFPRMEAIVWFDMEKEADWRVESSSASLRAFRSSLDALD